MVEREEAAERRADPAGGAEQRDQGARVDQPQPVGRPGRGRERAGAQRDDAAAPGLQDGLARGGRRAARLRGRPRVPQQGLQDAAALRLPVQPLPHRQDAARQQSQLPLARHQRQHPAAPQCRNGPEGEHGVHAVSLRLQAVENEK